VDEFTFRDRHGVDVFARRWPVANADGVVVIAHGASEHSGRYDRFARALNDAGFAAYALDHRGHGRTADATGKGCMGPPGGDALVDDLDQLVDRALGDHPDAPVVVFGHSLGSMITLAYVTRHSDRLVGAVLCGFPASVRDIAALGEMFVTLADGAGRDEPVDALAAFNEPFAPARTPFDWLSRDAAEVDRYVADPLCGDDLPLTHGFFAEMFAIAGPAVEPAALASIACPVFLIGGDRDSSGAMGENPRLLEAAMRDAGVTVECRLYPDARHELLNETNRDEVTADVVAWIRALPAVS
jgi:alpha-beta hydrolase superfamily lysophospholipase